MLGSKTKNVAATFEDLDLILSKWNLQRIRLICMLTFLMQLVNLFDHGVQSTPYLLFATVALVSLSFGYFWYLFFFLNNIRKSKKKTTATVIVFWMLYIFCNTFFCARDAEQQRTPLSFLICIVLLTVVPILSAKLNLLVFGTAIILGIIASMRFRAGVLYYLYIVIFALGGIIFSHVISKNYLSLIKKLNQSSTYDSLTKLFNRRTGLQRGGTLYDICKREHTMFAVIMCDIDNFKAINDQFGHQRGDEILAGVASAIQSTFRRRQDIVCRLGGEEFAVFCTSDSEQTIHRMASQLVTAVLNLKMASGNHAVSRYVSISVGYICYGFETEKTPSLSQLITQADMAMYLAKSTGKNRCCSAVQVFSSAYSG